MNQTELNIILEHHQLWLDSSGKKGKKADLEGVNLRYTDLEGANLEGAILGYTDLKRVNFKGVILRYADLRGADLQGVNLEGANLEGVILRNANLKGANLEGVNLEEANLEHCYVTPGTKILGNMLLTEFYNKYRTFWVVKSWVELDEAGLAMELYR